MIERERERKRATVSYTYDKEREGEIYGYTNMTLQLNAGYYLCLRVRQC